MIFFGRILVKNNLKKLGLPNTILFLNVMNRMQLLSLNRREQDGKPKPTDGADHLSRDSEGNLPADIQGRAKKGAQYSEQ